MTALLPAHWADKMRKVCGFGNSWIQLEFIAVARCHRPRYENTTLDRQFAQGGLQDLAGRRPRQGGQLNDFSGNFVVRELRL